MPEITLSEGAEGLERLPAGHHAVLLLFRQTGCDYSNQNSDKQLRPKAVSHLPLERNSANQSGGSPHSAEISASRLRRGDALPPFSPDLLWNDGTQMFLNSSRELAARLK